MPSDPPPDDFEAALLAGRRLAEAETAPDSRDLAERAAFDKARRAIILANERLLVGLRTDYGQGLLRFMWRYSIITFVFLVFDAWNLLGFDLPEGVMVALVGGTAVSVLGVVGTIAAGLFRVPPSE